MNLTFMVWYKGGAKARIWIGESVGHYVWNIVRSTKAQVLDRVYDQVRDRVWDQFWWEVNR